MSLYVSSVSFFEGCNRISHIKELTSYLIEKVASSDGTKRIVGIKKLQKSPKS